VVCKPLSQPFACGEPNTTTGSCRATTHSRVNLLRHRHGAGRVAFFRVNVTGSAERQAVRVAAPFFALSTRQTATTRLRAGARERIRRAAHRHGARNVRIFGSVARGADRPDSDIDLLVDFDVRSGLFPLAGLQDELAALLGERVEVVPQDALAPHVAKNALAEAVPL
jgi:predicted nucleotidyltransferase